MNKSKNEAIDQAKAELLKLQNFRQEAEEKLREAMTAKTKILADYRIEALDSEALNEMLRKKLAFDPGHLSQIIEECKEKEAEVNRKIADIRAELAGEQKAHYKTLFDKMICEIQEIAGLRIAKAWIVACKSGGLSREAFHHMVVERALSENLTKAEKSQGDTWQ
jgi:uncharacterized tellurite resistance protein B-like protein